MKVKKTLRSILCMLVAVCISLGLFGTVPVKAGGTLEDAADEVTYSFSIQLAEGETDSFIIDDIDGQLQRHLSLVKTYKYYKDGELIGCIGDDVEDMSEYKWSVDSEIATVSDEGVVTFSSDIDAGTYYDVPVSVLFASDNSVISTFYFSLIPKYELYNTYISLHGKSVQIPSLMMHSIAENGYCQTDEAPDNLKLQKIEVENESVVTVDSTGLITPVSTTAGDKTTCTAYYTDGTTEYSFEFVCYIKGNMTNGITGGEVDSEIAGSINEDKLYIYSWDSDFGSVVDMFTDYYPQYADLIEFKNIDVGGLSDDYMEAIDAAAVSNSEPASLFAMYESLVATFASKDYVVPLSDIGYKDSWYENAFDFTKSWGSVDGKLTALTYSICPGLFYYNAEIAEKVFGTSDPDDIQELVKDWDTFKETAKKLADEGYYMLSSAYDMKYAALSSEDALASDGTYYLGGVVTEYLENAKELNDAGCFAGDDMWSDGWVENMTNGKVFACFGTTWFDASIQGNGVNNIYKVCEGPSTYKWGGTYLAATKACTNTGLAQLLLYTITSDETFLNLLVEQKEKDYDYTNNKNIAKKLADEGYLGSYSTLNSPFSALYNNALKLQLPEAYAEESDIISYVDSAVYYALQSTNSTDNDGKGNATTSSDGKGDITFVTNPISDAIEVLTDIIKETDSDAVISTEAPPSVHKHTIAIDAAVAATCTEDGLTEGTHCSTCNKVITAQKTVPATGHTIVTDAAVAATCTKDGLTEGSHCSTCNKVITAQETVPAIGNHDYKTSTTAATTAKDGKSITKCSVCGKASKTTTIYKASTVRLAKTTYDYTGKAVKPSVTIKDSKGNTIAKSNYTVTYPSSCKNVGTYTITIKFKVNYSGTKKLTYTIQPKATKLSSVKAGNKSFTAKWTKQVNQTTGYEIQYSTSSKFTKATKKTVTKNSTTSLKVSKLTKGKKYYVRIRTYKTVKVNGKNTNIYSSWSSAKTVTVK